jgi:SAM-dependent methyltransferase
LNSVLKSEYSEKWDACWTHVESQPWYPDEQVVRFLAHHISRKTGFGVEQVRFASGRRPVGLDIGCGKGRHIVLMSDLNIAAYGMDVSEIAIKFASEWLRSLGRSADLRTASITKLPYEDSQFDFVICHGVLDHALYEVRKDAIREVKRVLRNGGLFFVSLISERDSAFGHGAPIEEMTWLVEEGFERDIPQAFFDNERIRAEFEIFDLESKVLCESNTLSGRSLIGTDKHYQLDSRYYLTLRKNLEA